MCIRDSLRYDPERLKLLLEQLAVEAGITLLYETELTAAREGEEECQITARGSYQEIALSGKYLIDATGNASLVQALGGETEAADERERMIATLMFRISNVDLDQLDAFIHSPRLELCIRDRWLHTARNAASRRKRSSTGASRRALMALPPRR